MLRHQVYWTVLRLILYQVGKICGQSDKFLSPELETNNKSALLLLVVVVFLTGVGVGVSDTVLQSLDDWPFHSNLVMTSARS